MRLSSRSQAIIHQAVSLRWGTGAQVRLFGSRLDDTAKGGDSDLHVFVPEQLGNPIWEASLLAAQLQRQLDGRKVDVRLLDGVQASLPVDNIALSEGVLLT